MVGWENRHKEAHSATTAEKETLIFCTGLTTRIAARAARRSGKASPDLHRRRRPMPSKQRVGGSSLSRRALTAGSVSGPSSRPSGWENTWSGPSWRWTASCFWSLRAKLATGGAGRRLSWRRWIIWSSLPGSLPTSPTRARSWSAITGSTPTPKFIRCLELTFVAEKPPPVLVFELVALTAAEERGEYE